CGSTGRPGRGDFPRARHAIRTCKSNRISWSCLGAKAGSGKRSLDTGRVAGDVSEGVEPILAGIARSVSSRALFRDAAPAGDTLSREFGASKLHGPGFRFETRRGTHSVGSNCSESLPIR